MRYSFVLLVSLGLIPFLYAQSHGFVTQSARDIPIEAEVDVLVVGGSTAAVAAAQAAAAAGASVYLIAPRLYLGEDMCGTMRFKHAGVSKPVDALTREIFAEGDPAKPAHVKAVLARNLLDSGVKFIYGAYVTDVLRDAQNNPCGVIMANRAGRQIIAARAIIDATDYAWLCRLAGCRLSPWQGGELAFQRTLYTAQPTSKQKYAGRRVHLKIAMRDFSFASISRAETEAREKTADKDLLRGAEKLFCVPPTFVICHSNKPDDIQSFIPEGYKHLYVLSGMSGLDRGAMAKLLQPCELISSGITVGRHAATQKSRVLNLSGMRCAPPQSESASVMAGDVKERLTGTRPIAVSAARKWHHATTMLPVLDVVDVVVVGGGTAGAAAAIAAARQGAETLVVEYQEDFGGVGTLGQITKPYHGRKIGFAKEVPFPKRVEEKLAWYRAEMRQAGCRTLLYTLGCGAFVDQATVKGAVVSTPEGRGVILAKVVVDATGNADVAVAAGAAYRYGTIEQGDIALQGTGLSTRTPGKDFNNSDHMLVDENDMADVQRALSSTYMVNSGSFDVGSLLLTRERRRIVGDFTMRYIDQIAERTYPDSIVFSGSNYDSHGYPSSPFFALLPHDSKSRKKNHPAPGGTCYTPYRALLPAGLDGILVVGLAISMDRDASAMVRMQLDIANQGYAAGSAAAMAAASDCSPRNIDLTKLRQHLVEIGALEASVLTHRDNFPLADDVVAQSVQSYLGSSNPQEAGKALAVMFSHPDQSRTLLKKSYKQVEGMPKLLCAQALGVLGETDGVAYLIRAAHSIQQWEPRILQGSMAEYAHLPTPQDSIITALGCAGDTAALPVLLQLAETLDADVPLSHHRSVAMALEKFADPSAAPVLARVLAKPGMSGHAMTDVNRSNRTEERIASLREIVLARALYRCGDFNGVAAEILEQYRRDLRGLFARHADSILEPAVSAGI